MNKWIYLLAAVSLIYILDVYLREAWAASRARKLAKPLNKPLLNVGSGTTSSSLTGAKLRGDVNCDIAASQETACGPTTVCYCDVEDLTKFADKQFGVVLVANVMNYIPNKDKAIRELHRIADNVIITSNWFPWMQLGPGSKFPVASS